ncbi:hypothetical protein R5W24_001901 [Gemmata sp. JC717]|uniref:hypothetical protein n=1 Tax=Gemmata algarum TaxID=2975278 RepID=UPI0021BB2A4C|nr:hypothetical protein [Gemmata algarum]MDY3552812.1 hypothetical protein [Gemmata algarum]
MTEEEWCALTYPTPMLEEAPLTSERKLRLFAVACCRRIWPCLRRTNGRRAVEVAEQYADGTATAEQLDQASQAQHGAGISETEIRVIKCVTGRAVNEASLVLYASELYADSIVPSRLPETAWDEADSAESTAQAELLRDIFGNPFRPVTFSAEWRTGTVVSLAAQMYESRDFSAMPILADAFQDAGCDNNDVLNHCRDPKQVHVRGCWVVDLVLGKE